MDDSTLNFIYFLAIIGGLCFILFLSKILWSLIKAILPAKNYTDRYGAHTWAIITGGSDGIGLAFCEELAALGFNIIMVARNRGKMDEALTKIKKDNEKNEIETRYIVADFTECQRQDFFTRIMHEVQDLDISILVNNVGISNIGYLHEIPEKRILNEINVNIVSQTMMSYHLIQRMIKREKRSAIINVSSVAGENPLPYLSVYSATKAYNDHFSKSNEMEYSHKIDILSLRPMLVETNLSKKKKSCMVASKNECAQSAIKYLGIDYQTNGYYMHRLTSYLTTFFPTPVLRCIAESESRKVMDQEKEVRI